MTVTHHRTGGTHVGFGQRVERASRPLVGFGVLNENTINRLTCLHEIISRNSI